MKAEWPFRPGTTIEAPKKVTKAQLKHIIEAGNELHYWLAMNYIPKTNVRVGWTKKEASLSQKWCDALRID